VALAGNFLVGYVYCSSADPVVRIAETRRCDSPIAVRSGYCVVAAIGCGDSAMAVRPLPRDPRAITVGLVLMSLQGIGGDDPVSAILTGLGALGLGSLAFVERDMQDVSREDEKSQLRRELLRDSPSAVVRQFEPSDHSEGQPCGSGQAWLVPAMLSTPTPTMIKAIPAMARPLNRSPNNNQAPTAAPAVPNPDHVAYASPTPIVLRT
jgi:hypothetical protein